MPRLALAILVALAPVSLSACAVSASGSVSSGSGTMSPGTGPEGRPAQQADAAAPGGAGGEAAPPGAGPESPAAGAATKVAAAPCQPALSDTPTALFGMRMIIRLPTGVELAERNPFYAQSTGTSQRSNCGQPISYAAAGFFEFPANSTATMVRDQLIEMRGLPAASVTWSDEGSRGRTFTGAYTAPEDPQSGAPAVHGWFVLRESGERYAYFALFETDTAGWDALKSTFVASGRSLVIKPRAPDAVTAPASAPAATPSTGASGGISAKPAGSKAK